MNKLEIQKKSIKVIPAEQKSISDDHVIVRLTHSVVIHSSEADLYGCVGVIEDVGKLVQNCVTGEMIFCWTTELAEQVIIPAKNFIKIPAGIDSVGQAAFSLIVCNIMHLIRQCNIQTGEKVAVYGKNLQANLALQFLNLAGVTALAIEDKKKSELEQDLYYSIVTSIDLFEVAVEHSCYAGTIVISGFDTTSLKLQTACAKELKIHCHSNLSPDIVSQLTSKKIVYPYGYVRWSAQRNISLFLKLLAEKKIQIPDQFYQQINLTGSQLSVNLISEYTLVFF